MNTTSMNRTTIIILSVLTLLLVSSFETCAQDSPSLRLVVSGKDNEQVTRPELLIEQNGTTVHFSYIEKGEKRVSLPAVGKYRVVLSAIGFTPYDREVEIVADTTINVVLEPKVTNLSEVVITANRPTNFTATGEVFKLSRKSRALKDPYRALSEIPVLSVDIIGKSIKTLDGSEPLILVDGRLLNSGVSPILPSDIESVEVTEVVTARYLEQGYSKVVNIRLRPDRPTYIYWEGRTRHDVPLRNGSVGNRFEFGKTKFAIYGSLFYLYQRNDRTEQLLSERQEGITKTRKGEDVSRFNNLNGDINIKWVPTKNDYFSARFVYKNEVSHTDGNQVGSFSVASDPTKQLPLSINLQNRTTDRGVLGALFYQRTFSDMGTLDLYAHYNRGEADLYKSNEEKWNGESNATRIDIKTLRHQYTFNADYVSGDHSFGSFELGNHFVYIDDRLQNAAVTPIAKESISQLSNYSFATYQQRWGRIMLMTSLGVQGMYIKAGKRTSSYFRPRTSESLVFLIGKTQALRLSHVLTNTLPSSLQLISFSTSSNPLLREEGNINLRPNRKNNLRLSYSGTLKKLRLGFDIGQTWITDIIEPYIYQDGNQYVQTYINNGTYRKLTFGPQVNLRTNNLMVYLGSDLVLEHFNSQPRQWSWQLNNTIMWQIKENLVLTASLSYKNKDYSNISTTYYKNPSMADLSLAWFPTERIQISLGVPYIWGVREQNRIINNGGFYQNLTERFTSSSLRPFILFAYTIRKHSKLKIRDLMPNNSF